MSIIIHTSGKAMSEPGPAAIGVQICDANGTVLQEVKEAIGNSTSDFAAYQAVSRGLQLLVELYAEDTTKMSFEVFLDSELVKQQLNHECQVTNVGLIPFFIEIHNLQVAHFPDLTFTHVQPEFITEVDRLVHEALDT